MGTMKVASLIDVVLGSKVNLDDRLKMTLVAFLVALIDEQSTKMAEKVKKHKINFILIVAF